MCFKSFDGKLFKGSGENDVWRSFYQFEHFKPINFRHLYIQKNQFRLMLVKSLNAFEAIITFPYHIYIRISLEIFFYNTSRQGLVINNYCFHIFCGIMTVVIKISLVLDVVNRSCLANRRNKRLFIEARPK